MPEENKQDDVPVENQDVNIDADVQKAEPSPDVSKEARIIDADVQKAEPSPDVPKEARIIDADVQKIEPLAVPQEPSITLGQPDEVKFEPIKPDPREPTQLKREDTRSTPTSDTKVSAGRMVGRFFIEGELNAGGMGKIWKAIDPYEALEVRMRNDVDTDQIARNLVREAGVSPMDSTDQRDTKIKAYVDHQRMTFLGLSDEDRLDVMRSMGDISKSLRDPRVPRVVIKTLADDIIAQHPTVVQRFRQEIKWCSELRHENIVDTIECGEYNGIHYAVMKYVDAQDLGKTALTPEQSTNIVRKTLEGLVHAHEKGILHRDIKPENILVSRDHSVIKLTDFGLGKAIEDAVPKEQRATGSGMIPGTPPYSDPERANNKEVVKESDLYSLGATFYKLLTGRPPAKGENPIQTMMIVASPDDPAWVRELAPNVSEELELIVMMMLSKDIRYRLTTHETRDVLDHLIKHKDFNYRELTREQKRSNDQEVKELKQTIARLGKKVERASRSKLVTADSFDLAMKYERLAELLACDFGVYEKTERVVTGEGDDQATEDKKIYRSARVDALEHALAHYEGFFKHNANDTKLTQEQLVTKQFKKSLLEKKLAAEKRRMVRFEKTGAIKRLLHAPKSYKVPGLIAAGAAAVGLVVGGIMYNNHLEYEKQEGIKAQIVKVVKAKDAKDYRTAFTKLSEAKEQAKDYPSSHELNRRIDELRVLVENSENFDKALALYSSAKVSAMEKSDFAAARIALEDALTLEIKLSDEFKGRLDDIKINTASDLYSTMSRLLEGEDRKYAEASLGVDAITWFLNRITPAKEDHVKLVNSIKEKLLKDREEISTRKGHIEAFNGIVVDMLKTAAADYEKLDAQLKADKFFKRSDLNTLDEKLDTIARKLTEIDPKAVGAKDYDKRKASVEEIKGKVKSLGSELDIKQIAYLKNSVKALDDMVGSVVDYTADDAIQKISIAKASMDAAKQVYANVGQTAELKPVEEQLNLVDTRIRDLDEKASAYPKNLRLAKDGSETEKKEARASLVKTYVDVGRLSEAEKVLNDISDRTGLEVYATIVELEKKIADPSLHVKRTPFGLDQNVIDSYSAAVEAYRSDQAKGDKLAASLLELYVKTNIDVKKAENGIKEVKVLNDRVLELKDLIKNDPKQEYLKEFTEKEKAMSEKRDTLYKSLDGYGEAAKVLLETQGKSLPPLDAVKMLSEAYRSAKYPKRADAVIERFK